MWYDSSVRKKPKTLEMSRQHDMYYDDHYRHRYPMSRNTSDDGRYRRFRDESYYSDSMDMDHYQHGMGYYPIGDHRERERFRSDERYYRDYNNYPERNVRSGYREDVQDMPAYRASDEWPGNARFDWDMDDYEGRARRGRHYDTMTHENDDRWNNVFERRGHYRRGEGYGIGGYDRR